MRGDLAATSLPEIFEVIHFGKKTGILQLNYDNPILNTRYSFHQGSWVVY